MTRSSDLYLEDILGCKHEPEIPVTSDNGDIIYWLCRCGKKLNPENLQKPQPKKDSTE